jgi:hypothetical protein
MAVKAAKYDANSLVELNDDDPKLADSVAQEYGYTDYSDLKKSLNL